MDAALSALTAYGKKLSSTANNIANVNSDGYKKSRVTMQEGPNGGVKTHVQQIDSPGYPKETFENGEVVQGESSNVNLAEELTEMIPSKTAYSANLKTVKVQDQMLGSLLDIFS